MRRTVAIASIACAVIAGTDARPEGPAYATGAVTVGRGFSPGEQQQQTFRTATDVVIVDAAVRDRGRMVAGLTAADFELTDNGVKQTIESVEQSAVPIDLTVVVDTSGGPMRPRTGYIDVKKVEHLLNVQIVQIANQLRPTDRVRVLAIDRYVRQLLPFVPASERRHIRLVETDGLGSTYDTLAAAMLHAVEPWRRHVVIARAIGRESMSSVSAAAVGAVAEQSEALTHLVIWDSQFNTTENFAAFQAKEDGHGLAWPTNRFWIPFRRSLVERKNEVVVPTEDGLLVQKGVRAGGGDWHQSQMFSEPSLVSTFKQTFEEFRQGYVLRYAPKGVPPSGWHSIAVKVPKLRNARISARRGYGIEPPRTQPVRPVPALPQTIADITYAYERGAFQNVSNGIRRVFDAPRLMKEFEAAGNPWPANPRREAALAIEIAEPGLFSPVSTTREQAEALMVRFTRLIRHPFEGDAFERLWHHALLTQLQGAFRPNVTLAFTRRALDRFPNDPVFLLAEAISVDQRTAAGGVMRWANPTPTVLANLDAAQKMFEDLLDRPEVSAEARIRLAFLLHRRGRFDAALARLDEAAPPPASDPGLLYLHHFFCGHALGALNRVDEALASYRAAQAVIPTAQSARVASMNLSYREGNLAGAESLAEQIQAETAVYVDPWWIYWQGQYRIHAQVMARLREMAK